MAFQSVPLDQLLQKGRISALDVVRLHDALTHDGPVTADEAEQLFAIEQTIGDKHYSWKGLFIDAIALHAIEDLEPGGYLTALKADWLVRHGARPAAF